jgi:hypothetical protein
VVPSGRWSKYGFRGSLLELHAIFTDPPRAKGPIIASCAMPCNRWGGPGWDSAEGLKGRGIVSRVSSVGGLGAGADGSRAGGIA